MAKRTDVIPEDLLVHLRKRLPGFKAESVKTQMALAKLLWTGADKKRRHFKEKTAMSFPYQELYRLFGKGNFGIINERLGFFDTSPNWSMDRGETRAYWFTRKVQAIRDEYFHRDWRKLTRVLTLDGRIQKTLPPAIGSRGSRGNAAKVWGGIKVAPMVRVDLQTLKNTRKYLNTQAKEWEAGRKPMDLWLEYPTEEYLKYLSDMTSKIIRMAKTDIAGHGVIAQQYQESPSGRLYGLGVSLQNAPSLIKEAALNGLWEYDFANCHFAILDQMATAHGFICNHIQHYLTRKREVREAIASRVGITVDQVKTCLVALLYGAKESLRHTDAIPDEIGVEAAERLYQEPLFRGLKTDIQASRRVIVEAWPRKTANGSLTNDCGKAIAGDASPPEKLAHLLQGVEAAALKAAFNAHPGQIVLFQHDGFASLERLALKPLEARIQMETGYRLFLEEKQIRLNPERQFLKAQNAKR